MLPIIKHGGQVRTTEQLLLLLKLVDTNGIDSKRRNLNVRQKIWESIAERLNQLGGAYKDAEGWKRCFISWRASAGKNYKEDMLELLQKLPNDENYFIEVSDEEIESDNEGISYMLKSDPSEAQNQRLHELVFKNKELLLSNANDKPLKVKLWENITEELNRIPGAMSLTPAEWEKLVDWDKYKTKKGRKPNSKNKTSEFEFHTISDTKIQEYSSTQSINMLSSNDETTQNSNTLESPQRLNGHSRLTSTDEIDLILEEAEQDMNDEYLFEFSDQDDYEPNLKRIKPTPLANSFKSTIRIANAVECLKDDVRNMGNSLKQTTENLDSLKTLLERQCQQQEEFNTLLRRNTQLLKVLVEFKIGKRTSISKKKGLPTINGSEDDI